MSRAGRRGRRARRVALAALAGLAVAVSGCASLPAPQTASVPLGDTEGTRQLMVTFAQRPESQWQRAVEELAANYELEVLFRWPLESLNQECVVFGLPDNRTLAEILSRVAADPRVRLAQPVQQFRVLAYNDPHSQLQHGLIDIHVAEAHRSALGRGVRIAVIDTGVDVAHPDLEGRVVKAQSFVQGDHTFTADVHGTAIAGVIAARANNSLGIVGVAPDAVLYALKACWQESPTSRTAVCDSYTLAQAIDFALHEGAQVLNFSLTGPRDPLLAELIDAAYERGIVVLAAAGPGTSGANDTGANEASDGPAADYGFPASHPHVLAVHAVGTLGEGATGAAPAGPTGGRHVQLAAPGLDILSTAPRNGYDFYSGSSLAVAQVSGVVALLLERQPALTPDEVADLLRRTARQLADCTEVGGVLDGGAPGRGASAGGCAPLALIDAGAALATLAGPP